MKTCAAFVADIQCKLPCAKLLLQKKSGPLFDWQLCTLTATSMVDSSKTFTMTFEDGLGGDPLAYVAKSFVGKALHVLNG